MKFKTNIKFIRTTALLAAFVTMLGACRKLIEIDPPIQDIVGKEIYRSDATAASVLTGIYASMSYYGIFSGTGSMPVLAGLAADELGTVIEPDNTLFNFYTNSLTKDDGGIWGLYTVIFKVNGAIEGITASDGITAGAKRQLIGEAKFLRAFMYFYLVNAFGDVPLVLTTDVMQNKNTPRVAQSLVYEQMIKDLQEARELLDDRYLNGRLSGESNFRERPNKAAATALLARVHLFAGNWSLAEEEASRLIGNTARYILEPDLNNVFLATSREAIFQLQPTVIALNTIDASFFVLEANGALTPAGPNINIFGRPVYLSSSVYNAFEPGDDRKLNWLDSVTVDGTTYAYPYKYKVWLSGEPITEYTVVFRLAEQYLIRAEARMMLGKLNGTDGADADLNAIRARAGLGEIHPASPEAMRNAIIQERRVELFTEWGHRWFDLKRAGMLDDVMIEEAPKKGGTWQPYKALLPIPVGEFERNPSLRGHQNPGYPES